MSKDMSKAVGFKKPSEFLDGLWRLDKLEGNPNFRNLNTADMILDEKGKQLEVNGKKLSEFLNDPAANFQRKTLDSFLKDYFKENPDKSLQVIGPDAKLHTLGGKSFNGNMEVTEFGYDTNPEPEPKKPGLWARFLNLFIPQKSVQEYNDYQRLQSSPIMQKCQEAKAALEDLNRVLQSRAPGAQAESKQKTADPFLGPDRKMDRIDTPEEAGIVLGGDATGPIMNKMKNNGMFNLAKELYMEIRDRDADKLTDSQNEICMFAENTMVSMQALEDYANNPKGVDTKEVKEHIANVVTFGIVASDRTKQFKILDGTTAEDLSASVANSPSFQSIMDNYSANPKAENSLVDLARKVSKGQVSEVSGPFRESLPKVRADMDKAPAVNTAQRTQTRDVEPAANVL